MRGSKTRQYLCSILLVFLISVTLVCCTSSSDYPSSTPFPTAVQYKGGQTVCDHPYFPLQPGTQWIYKRTFQTLLYQQEFTLNNSDFQTGSTECGGLEYGSPEKQKEY